MYTHMDHINGKATLFQFYSQFVTPSIKQYVRRCLVNYYMARKVNPDDNILSSLREHSGYNQIPLKFWDDWSLVIPLVATKKKMKVLGDILSQAGMVCITKAAAREIARDISLQEGEDFFDFLGKT